MATFARQEGMSFQSIIDMLTAVKTDKDNTVVQLDRRPSAQGSLVHFLRTANRRPTNILGMHMSGVGLRPEGRSGVYDLWWLKSTPGKVYAVDHGNDNVVFAVNIS